VNLFFLKHYSLVGNSENISEGKFNREKTCQYFDWIKFSTGNRDIPEFDVNLKKYGKLKKRFILQ
jgi:hypothetical protein